MSARTPDAMAMATVGRRDLADLRDTLTDDEWTAPSLCEGWSVRDVVAHLISDEHLGWPGAIGRMVRARRAAWGHSARATGLRPPSPARRRR